MTLTKPNQQLRRDLKEAAALLKWSGVDLMRQEGPCENMEITEVVIVSMCL